eukprot:g27687.t1
MSFVDNVELIASGVADLCQGFAALTTWGDTLQLEFDPPKTHFWATQPAMRAQLKALGLRVTEAGSDLGAAMVYGGRLRNKAFTDRIKSATPELSPQLAQFADVVLSHLRASEEQALPLTMLGNVEEVQNLRKGLGNLRKALQKCGRTIPGVWCDVRAVPSCRTRVVESEMARDSRDRNGDRAGSRGASRSPKPRRGSRSPEPRRGGSRRMRSRSRRPSPRRDSRDRGGRDYDRGGYRSRGRDDRRGRDRRDRSGSSDRSRSRRDRRDRSPPRAYGPGGRPSGRRSGSSAGPSEVNVCGEGARCRVVAVVNRAPSNLGEIVAVLKSDSAEGSTPLKVQPKDRRLPAFWLLHPAGRVAEVAPRPQKRMKTEERRAAAAEAARMARLKSIFEQRRLMTSLSPDVTLDLGDGVRQTARSPQQVPETRPSAPGQEFRARRHDVLMGILVKLLEMKLTWVLITLLTVSICYAIAQPMPCNEDTLCRQNHEQIQDENLVFLIGEAPWFAHSSNLGHPDLDHQPVYSVFYAEWLINVPILLILAGSCCLQRPPREFLLQAWVAHFISNAPLRYVMVVVSFLMYFRASWTMCQRPLLSFALIIVFGIYGAVYLARLHGAVSCRNERIFFTTMDFTTKLFASIALAGIRSSEFQEVLLTMLANTQTSFKRALNYDDRHPMIGSDSEEMELPKRQDLRHLNCVTIDPPQAKDLDDAISVSPGLKPGSLRVGVHIADGLSDAATLAQQEGPCVQRSEQGMQTAVWSAHGDRLSFSVFFSITSGGELDDTEPPEMCRGVIRTRAKLNYDQVDGFLTEGRGEEIPSELQGALRSLATLTAEPRTGRKLMVLANHVVAERLVSAGIAKEGEELLPSEAAVQRPLLRCHPETEPEVKSALLEILPKEPNERPTVSDESRELQHRAPMDQPLQALLQWCSAELPPVTFEAVCDNVLKSFKEAQYLVAEDESPVQHWALALPTYMHFTSPIRRYADVLVHRRLAYLLGENNSSPKMRQSHEAFLEGLKNAVDVCNTKKRDAQDAQMEEIQMVLSDYVHRVGGVEVDDAVITRILVPREKPKEPATVPSVPVPTFRERVSKRTFKEAIEIYVPLAQPEEKSDGTSRAFTGESPKGAKKKKENSREVQSLRVRVLSTGEEMMLQKLQRLQESESESRHWTVRLPWAEGPKLARAEAAARAPDSPPPPPSALSAVPPPPPSRRVQM